MNAEYLRELKEINGAFYNKLIASETDIDNKIAVPNIANEEEIKNIIEGDNELKKEYTLYRAYQIISTILYTSDVLGPPQLRQLIEEAESLEELSQQFDYGKNEQKVFYKLEIYKKIAEIEIENSVVEKQKSLQELNTQLGYLPGYYLIDKLRNMGAGVFELLFLYGDNSALNLDDKDIINKSDNELLELLEETLLEVMQSLKINVDKFKEDKIYDSIVGKQLSSLKDKRDELKEDKLKQDKGNGLQIAGVITYSIGIGLFAGAIGTAVVGGGVMGSSLAPIIAASLAVTSIVTIGVGVALVDYAMHQQHQPDGREV